MYKILLTGGGTGGSVMPLIAIYQYLSKSKKIDWFWIGGYEGVEKNIVAGYSEIKYQGISSGKLRRYFSLKNFGDIFKIISGFFQSIIFLIKTKPDMIITAGSYVSVPVVWAGWLLKIPIIVHQQDLQAGLANKLMAGCAKKITVSWKESLKDYPAKKTIYTGNPVRQEFLVDDNSEIESLKNKYNLDKSLPIILILGGGTGAIGINLAVEKHLAKLIEFANIFHITGKGKKIGVDKNLKNINNYHQFEFITQDLINIMKMSDLVITRAGMSTLCELAVLGKPTIIVPMPDSHQEKNAEIFCREESAICCKQEDLENEDFIDMIQELVNNKAELDSLGLKIKKLMPSDAVVKIGGLILYLVNRQNPPTPLVRGAL